MEHEKDGERSGRAHGKGPQPRRSGDLLETSALSLCIALLGFGLFFPCFWLKFPHVSENFKSVLWSWYVYSIHLGEGKAISPLYINTNALRGCT